MIHSDYFFNARLDLSRRRKNHKLDMDVDFELVSNGLGHPACHAETPFGNYSAGRKFFALARQTPTGNSTIKRKD